MKRLRISWSIFISLLVFIGIYSCSDSDLDRLPTSIQTFVSQYFPGIVVSSYDQNTQNGSITVKLRNDATLTFDGANRWTDINGNGSPLPPALIYDQLPPQLYNYLESIESTEGVYRLTRDATHITVQLLDNRIEYDQTTKTINFRVRES